jgi:hypothetical protein
MLLRASLVLGVLLIALPALAVESHIGTVRITSEVTCLNNCDNYMLEPDDQGVTYFLRGVDLVLYVGRHVQVFGFRSYCGGCLVINVTAVVRLPLTGVELIDDRLPGQTQLMQNFPNPFNPSTAIRYQIASAGSVSLKVYDMLGSEVATLVSTPHAPGTYELSWNASEFPSGMYYYRLLAGGTVMTKKMIYLK